MASSSTSSGNYPWPSTLNVANFVSVRPWLDKDNPQKSIKGYNLWKEQMICLLESQDFLGFIDGETPAPPPDHPDQDGESMGKLWRRTDSLIKGWILGTIGHDALEAVVGLNSSMEVWLALENIFNRQMKAAHTILVRNRITSVGNDQNRAGVDEDRIVELPAEASHNALDQRNVGSITRKDMNSYLPLYKAALRGDWKEAGEFLTKNKEGSTVILNSYSDTLLHASVERGKSNDDFLRNLLEIIPKDALDWKRSCGLTALHAAAAAGNTGAAMKLVNEKHELLYNLNDHNLLPIHLAAIGYHKETLKYLISKSEMDVKNSTFAGHLVKKSPFAGHLGATLLSEMIASEFVDLALYLVKKYPDMATLRIVKECRHNECRHDVAPLQVLAETNSLFLSGESLSWWQNWIYSCIALEPSTLRKHNDIEKSLSFDDQGTSKFGWSEIFHRVPCVKRIKDKKVMHQEAIELAKLLCVRTAILPHSEAEPIFQNSIIKAAQNGIHEVVEMIIDMFPSAAFVSDAQTGSGIFLLAARERFENVFSLIHKTNDRKHFFFDKQDSSKNNVMHMCGKIAPPHKLNLVSGAALQMQRELQWFEEMKKFVNPSRRKWKNKDGLTPSMLFTKEHKELKEEGEKWMKATASSCTIAAALIATVMFSSAFNVPGGVNTVTGIPTLLHKTSFILFTISDSVSLLTSATSLLIFLSILTSRYAEEDFLHVLPKRLCMGLIALFTSIIFMVITFTVAVYITVEHKSRLILIPVALLACFPVATFAFLQFPLLMDVLRSTYGPGLFGKNSGRIHRINKKKQT